MIPLLFIRNYITSQVVHTCSQQSDCYVGYYCDVTEMCYDCSYVTPASCDSIDQDCCSAQFRRQCVTNPHQCPGPSDPSGPSGLGNNDINPVLKTFLMIFSLVSLSYLLAGSYINKYVNLRSGYDILPHREFWREFRSLVRDGVSFSYRVARHKIGYTDISEISDESCLE